MSLLERILMHGGVLVVGSTGLAYALFKHLMVNDDPFSAVNHPMQPWALSLHVVAAPALIFGIGMIFRDHIAGKMRNGSPAVIRRVGTGTLILFLPLAASGYLLQVLTGDRTRTWTMWIHLGLGIAFVLIYGVHLVTVAGRIAARRRASTLAATPAATRVATRVESGDPAPEETC